MSGDSHIPVIGLVGGVGAGKSTVADAFAELGCAVIDADKLGHEVIQAPAVRDALVERWGTRIIGDDGRVDRSAVGEIVFDDEAELAFLNEIMHPRIAERIAGRIDELRNDPGVSAIVLDAAVMLEAGWDHQCDVLVFVDAPEAVRFARVLSSRGWSETTWRERENSQFSIDRKAASCDYCLRNSSSESHLREQVRTLFHRIVSRAD
ncbi:MAG: dephospho-CoA kinase [Phycisphaerae bacterium]